MTELRKAMIIRGLDEEDVVRCANSFLSTGQYEMPMKPVAVSAVTGAGPLMMIILERVEDGSGP